MPQKPKKPVETIASLKAELKFTKESFDKLLEKYVGLKTSFGMVKANFEREKERLDKTIDSLLNVTKAK